MNIFLDINAMKIFAWVGKKERGSRYIESRLIWRWYLQFRLNKYNFEKRRGHRSERWCEIDFRVPIICLQDRIRSFGVAVFSVVLAVCGVMICALQTELLFLFFRLLPKLRSAIIQGSDTQSRSLALPHQRRQRELMDQKVAALLLHNSRIAPETLIQNRQFIFTRLFAETQSALYLGDLFILTGTFQKRLFRRCIRRARTT